MAIPIPDDVRELLQAPNYVHLSTLRADGSPRNWVAWAGPEDDHLLVCNPVRPGLNVVVQGSTSATSSSPRVIA